MAVETAGVNWEFAISEVLIAIDLCKVEHRRASTDTQEKQLRIWGTWRRFRFLSVTSSMSDGSFVKLQEFWVVDESRNSGGPSGHHGLRTEPSRVLGRPVEWTAESIT